MADAPTLIELAPFDRPVPGSFISALAALGDEARSRGWRVRDRRPRGRQGAGLDRAARGSRNEGPLLASTHAKGAHPLASSRGFATGKVQRSCILTSILGTFRLRLSHRPRRGATPGGTSTPSCEPGPLAFARNRRSSCGFSRRRLSGVLCPAEEHRGRSERAGLAEPADPRRSERDRPRRYSPATPEMRAESRRRLGDSRGRRSAAAFRMELANQGRAALHRSGVSSRRGRREACARARRRARVIGRSRSRGSWGCRTTFARLAPSRASPASSRRRMYSWP